MRQKEIEGLLGPLESDMFAQLVAMGKLITDYKSEADLAQMAEEGIDDDIGVAVEFEDEEEEDDEQVPAWHVLSLLAPLTVHMFAAVCQSITCCRAAP